MTTTSTDGFRLERGRFPRRPRHRRRDRSRSDPGCRDDAPVDAFVNVPASTEAPPEAAAPEPPEAAAELRRPHQNCRRPHQNRRRPQQNRRKRPRPNRSSQLQPRRRRPSQRKPHRSLTAHSRRASDSGLYEGCDGHFGGHHCVWWDEIHVRSLSSTVVIGAGAGATR